jgi:hypothetical protein
MNGNVATVDTDMVQLHEYLAEHLDRTFRDGNDGRNIVDQFELNQGIAVNDFTGGKVMVVDQVVVFKGVAYIASQLVNLRRIETDVVKIKCGYFHFALKEIIE